ncbi:hypothetical protein J2Y67_002399 [Neobacillus niacini]|nr:aminoglycoside 6-adenylyltransferase [Neobacillus niacini]MDR6999944.1 hypothetical protein [Neobacillus niacini]
MLEWSIGIQTNFSKSAGSFGKYLIDFLEKNEWDEFVSSIQMLITKTFGKLFLKCVICLEKKH